jgi:uncharacterized membrane protein
MDPIELGIDRTVVTMWAPDDTWPALLDDYAEGEAERAANADVQQFGRQGIGRSGSSPSDMATSGLDDPPSDTDRGAPARTDLDVPANVADIVAPIPDEPNVRLPVPAVAAIDGHPLHPVVVPLPIGAFVGAFAADVAYLRTRDRFWARGARMLTGAGLATGLLAGSLGALDFTGRRPIRRHPSAWVHAGGNLAVLALALGSLALRARDERASVAKGGIAISASIATILLVTGWLGGELAYRERIGVIPG